MVKRVRLSKPVKRVRVKKDATVKKLSRRKKILSIPLHENTLESLEKLSVELGLTKTEIARQGIKFALKSKKFLSLMS